ncbi:MAG: 8-oxo-dGTP diphosphatase [Candidatus Kerfeldbacteria bacterium]|nr:8-oxo-dGTP diphosphatase [Candidatus Kerfeldbacteria bacterium]
MTNGVLVYILKGAHILLAMKKRGFGVGRWNGTGGKVEFGENARLAGIRETKEEIGLTPTLDKSLGTILYHDSKVGDWKVTVFRTEEFEGQPVETDEMKPQWFPVDQIPYAQMWSGDDQWLPYVISGQKFEAEMWFDGNERNIKADVRAVKE